jgi:hypothetical protein
MPEMVFMGASQFTSKNLYFDSSKAGNCMQGTCCEIVKKAWEKTTRVLLLTLS